MRIYFLVLIYFITPYCFAQSKKVPGTCNSYTITGNTVTFHCSNNQKVSLKLCSSGVVKIWYAPTGDFKRNNSSFAVINEELEEMSNIHVEEQAQSYEIFTSKLRIRLNKDPFQLQLFDKYQKLLLSDFKDQGLLSDSGRIISYKSLRNDEQF